MTVMRRENVRLVRARTGRRTTALTMLVGLLLVPTQSEAAAGVCAPPGGRTTIESTLGVVSESTGLSIGLNETAIRWVRWNTRVVYGDSATLAGQVVTQDGAIANATVNLLARPAGSQDWTTVASASTDPDTGVFSFTCLEPTRTTEYRAVYHGSVLYAGSEGVRTVEVARRVPDAMTQVASAGFRFEGSVEPRYAGRRVLLQRKSCASCRWGTVSGTDANTRSGWLFPIDVSGFTGDRWYRAVVPEDASYARSYSARTWRLSHR